MTLPSNSLLSRPTSLFARYLGLSPTSRSQPRYALAAWAVVLISILGLLFFHPPYGCDLKVYGLTIHQLQANISPYQLGIAHLEAGHSNGHFVFSMNYLYPPMTLPLLRALGHLPREFCAAVYMALSAISFLALLWIGLRCQERQESRLLPLIAPFAVFFPGLLSDDVWLHGNIVFLLYALLFSAAYWGWKRGQWRYFYAAILIATYFKAPMLIFLAIPLLSASGQILPAILTGSASSVIYFSQRFLWPAEYQSYLRMMNLEFLYNGEFGFSPAGLLGKFLCDHNHSYVAICAAFYLCAAAAIFLILYRLSMEYKNGRISFAQWIPLLLVGVMLLYPRIKQYDVAVITLPMAILFWRALRERANSRRTARFYAVGIFAICNILVVISNSQATYNAFWEVSEMAVMVGLFVVSARSLYAQCVETSPSVLLPELQRSALHAMNLEYARSIEEA